MNYWHFDLDRANSLLRITLRGFWDDAVMDRYEPLFFAQMSALRRLPAPVSCLVDVRAMEIQSQAVAERSQAMLAALGPRRADRVAMVLEGALFRLQAARIGSAIDHRVFESDDEAVAWLLRRDAA